MSGGTAFDLDVLSLALKEVIIRERLIRRPHRQIAVDIRVDVVIPVL